MSLIAKRFAGPAVMLALLTGVAASGCGSTSDTVKDSTAASSKPTPANTGEDSGHIAKATFKGDWPFTVNEAQLGCDPPGIVVTLDGNSYALNGTAQDMGHPKLPRRLWLDDPNFEGLKVSVSDVMNAAFKYCDL